jgi:uncharacterized protein YegP (UPF0339 family)
VASAISFKAIKPLKFSTLIKETLIMAKFTLYKDKSGEYRFNLKAGNGEIIGASEGYKAKASAENGIESVKKNATEESRYELKEAKNGKFHFNLKASNGQVILSSQMYASKDSAQNGIQSVMKNAADASTQDDSEAASAA